MPLNHRRALLSLTLTLVLMAMSTALLAAVAVLQTGPDVPADSPYRPVVDKLSALLITPTGGHK
jgi:hypothetical protein